MCSLCILPFLLLLSYNIVFLSSSYTQEQQEWFSFFDGNEIPTGYTDDEISHMIDVKYVMRSIDVAFGMLIILLLGIGGFVWNSKQMIAQLLRIGGLATLFSLCVFGLFAYFSYDFVFTLFHDVFFPQGNWLFPTDSRLIQTFPLSFFVNMTTKIISLSLLLSIIIMYISTRVQTK